jgi:hypothetical protein
MELRNAAYDSGAKKLLTTETSKQKRQNQKENCGSKKKKRKKLTFSDIVGKSSGVASH